MAERSSGYVPSFYPETSEELGSTETDGVMIYRRAEVVPHNPKGLVKDLEVEEKPLIGGSEPIARAEEIASPI